MDIFLIVLGSVLVIIGIIGSIVPIIPGPPITFSGLLLVHFTAKQPFTIEILITFGVLAVLSSFIDNILPVYATKKFNGSKRGVWGSAIGLVIGIFFFPPFGIIVGPMLGAYVGEIIDGKSTDKAFKPAFGSLIGFITSIFLRLALSMVMAYFFIKEVIL